MSEKKTWDARDPDEVLDYLFDWSARRLDGLNQLGPGDSILTATSTVVFGTATVDTTLFGDDYGLKTVTWLRGGVEGETTEILLKITTQFGRHMDQTMYQKIKKR